MSEKIADIRKLDELPFKSPRTRIITIKGVNFEIYEELPYIVGASVADIWIKSMMGGNRSLESADLRETLNQILLSVVVKPKLTKKFIESNKCPNEFVGIAMNHFTKIIQGFSMIEDAEEPEYIDEDELIEEEI